MNNNSMGEEKYTAIEIAEIVDVSIDEARKCLRDFLEVSRLPRNRAFTPSEINRAFNYHFSREFNLNIDFNFKLECAKTIFNSNDRVEKLFNSAYGIKNGSFPPALKIYERLLSKKEIERIKESWSRKRTELNNQTLIK